MHTSSAATTSWPASTAASASMSDRAAWIRMWSGPNSARWHRAPPSRAGGSGADRFALLLLTGQHGAGALPYQPHGWESWQHAADGRPAGAAAAFRAESDELLDALPGIDFGRIDVAVGIDADLVQPVELAGFTPAS